MMTKLQRPHGAAHKRGVKCSATDVRIVLHGRQNNKKAPAHPAQPRKISIIKKVFHHD
jgi:hypothetical protein